MKNEVIETLEKIDKICIEFYFFRNEDILDSVMQIIPKIQTWCEQLIDILEQYPMDEDAVTVYNFTIETINDIVSAIEYNDQVLLIDTLDFGIREVLNLLIQDED